MNSRRASLLSDFMGEHIDVLHGVDADPGTPPVLVMQPYDAFGVPMGPGRGGPGSLAWRGVEGSQTDGGSLVYMQSRHYDPTLGRFLQADSLPLASLTTQGMNRYIYCENDPVNRSDASGRFWAEAWGILNIAIGGALAFLAVSAAIGQAAAALALVGSASLIAGALVGGFLFLGLLGAIGAIANGIGWLSKNNEQRCTLFKVSSWISLVTGWTSLTPVGATTLFDDVINLASWGGTAWDITYLITGTDPF